MTSTRPPSPIANELCDDFDVSQRRGPGRLDLARSSLRYAGPLR